VNQYDKDGATPLMLAAACNPDPEAIETLLQAGAKLDAGNKDGVTVLMTPPGRTLPSGRTLKGTAAYGALKTDR
jgi:hypothetical protein